MPKFQFGLIVFLLVIGTDSGVIAQTTPELIVPEELSGTVKLRVLHLPHADKESWVYESLSIFVKNERDDYSSNAVQGRYEVAGKSLLFKPYFPFERGMTYVVRTRNAKSENRYVYQPFQIGNKIGDAKAKVLRIYPSADQLPENLLRFYIYFNTPMRKGEALNHIKLVDSEGNMDSHAFMEFKQELWSSDGRRLTLLFDPGRIKRGVSTNIQRGSALIEGRQFKLVIADTWEDAYGQELSEGSMKTIEVIGPYRKRINVSNWNITKPKPNSLDKFTLHFDRIMDHALIQSMIQIVDAKSSSIPGYWELLEEERSMVFIPKKNWKKGKYSIRVDSRLEDSAGNNLRNPLDHMKTDKAPKTHPFYNIDFKI